MERGRQIIQVDLFQISRLDGCDLYETFDRKFPLNHALERNMHRAVETDLHYIGVRDLFPQ